MPFLFCILFFTKMDTLLLNPLQIHCYENIHVDSKHIKNDCMYLFSKCF